MTTSLFRKEAIAARGVSWLGDISLAHPPKSWVFTASAAAAAVAIALFLVFGTYTRRSTVSGALVPSNGLATVAAPATGVITKLDFAEGEAVSAGQALLLITIPRTTASGTDTQRGLEAGLGQRRNSLLDGQAAQLGMLDVQESSLRDQLSVAKQELEFINLEIGTRREQVELAKEELDRFRQLEGRRYVSVAQTRQQELGVLTARGELQDLQREAAASRRTILQLNQSLHELPTQRQVAEADRAKGLAILDQEQIETQARGALVVNAPISGLLSAQMVKVGQAVREGQPLLAVLPKDGKLEAELLVPSRAIGFVEPGDRVLLRYQAYPYQKFGHHEGVIASISRSAVVPDNQGGASEPCFRVTVKLADQSINAYGNREMLRPGMQLEADILGERRRLIEWLLEPLYSLRGKVRVD